MPVCMGQIIADRKRKSDWDWFKRDKRLYDCWLGMRRRIRLNHLPTYSSYAGLTICEEWQDYWQFHEWAMANGYADNLTIDRIDNYKGYSPDNCRWVTIKTQMRNKKSNRNVTIFGETKIAMDWANDPRCAVSWQAFYDRLRKGWEPERALTAPADSTAGKSRLTAEDVAEIKRLHNVVSQKKLAEQFGISRTMVQAIHYGRSWGHVVC